MLKKLTNMNGQDFMLTPIEIDYDNRILSLVGEINMETAFQINSALRCLGRDSDDDITLYIQSPGGSVSAGFSIYDTIQFLPCDVVTVASGMVASMAAFLLAAAGTKGKRYVHPNAEVLIHQPLGGVSGQASDIRIHANHVLHIKDRINQILAASTNQPIEKITSDTDRDYILDSNGALEYGIVDYIGDPLSEEERYE